MFASLIFIPAMLAQFDKPVVLNGPDGFAFTFTGNGLTQVRQGQRMIADGAFIAWDAGPRWFGTPDGKVATPVDHYLADLTPGVERAMLSSSVSKPTEKSVIVKQTWPKYSVTHNFTLAGNDLKVSSKIDNLDESVPIAFPAVGGVHFRFQRAPEGWMSTWHTSYLAHIKLGAFHPSPQSPIGGSYAADGAIGIGVAPADPDPDGRSLIFWDFDSWEPHRRDREYPRWLAFLDGASIPPGGARTLRQTIRFSLSQDWKVLLEPYKRQLLRHHGPRKYDVDSRLLAVAYINRDAKSISPENPYGLHGGDKRLDTPEGRHLFLKDLVPALKKVNGQGVLMWGQTGEVIRGEMYRTDFDVIPPPIVDGLAQVNKSFSTAGLRWGVCTRPGETTYRRDWLLDGSMALSGNDPEHLRVVAKRFKNLTDKGASIFYLDSFGNTANDIKIMRHLRKELGPKVSTFVEHSCDVMLAYSGVYTETDFYGKDSEPGLTEPQYRPRTSLRFLEICRWMLGDIPVISRLYERRGEIPLGFPNERQFFLRSGITPMITHYDLPGLVPTLLKEYRQASSFPGLSYTETTFRTHPAKRPDKSGITSKSAAR